MATFLDIELLRNFQVIFPFLLVFCITYGVIAYTKIFGENKGLQAMIAIIFAFMSLFSDIVTETINTSAPWFVLLLIFTVFLLMGFMVLGVKEADVMSLLKNPEYSFINWWIAAIVIIIIIGSLSHTLAQKKGGYPPFIEDGNFTEDDGVSKQESDFWQTIFHPKVLGLLALLIIAFFTISKLTSGKEV